jgi:hypothetical protein
MAIAVAPREEHLGRRCPSLRSCAHELRGALALILVCVILVLLGMGAF